MAINPTFAANQPERGTEGFSDSIEHLPINSGTAIFRYPETLGQAVEYRSYVGFDIFDSAGTSLDTNQVTNQGPVSQTPQERESQGFFSDVVSNVGDELSAIGSGIASAASGLGSAVKGAYGAVVGDLSALTEGIGTSIGNSSNGGAIMNTKTGSGYTQERTGLGITNKKMLESIYLYMPSVINTNYGISYTDTNFADTQTAIDMLSGAKAVLTGGGGAEGLAAGLAKQAGRAFMDKKSSQLSSFLAAKTGGQGLKVDMKGRTEASERNIANPMMINMFKEVSRRTFDFSYIFLPTSRKEMSEVYDIIKLFKKYSMPKRTDGGRFVDFPAEFLITFYYNGNINSYLPKIFKCACTKVDVKYGNDAGPFVVFATPGDNGAPPVQLRMDLSFTETQILTRDEIEAGY